MEIYLLRHGIAEDRTATGKDADRGLTEDGREKLLRVMARARRAGVAPSLILSSPLKRAIETAEVAAGVLEYRGEILRVEALKPMASPQEVWAEIRSHRDETAILLAGHEPLFSSTAAYFLGSPRTMVEFKKGALMRIDVESLGVEPKGVLQWMLTPKLSHK